MSSTLMMSAAVDSSFFVFRMRAGRVLLGVGRVAPHERHDGDAGLEAREAERELRKQDDRHRRHHRGIAVLREERRPPVRDDLRDAARSRAGPSISTTTFSTR